MASRCTWGPMTDDATARRGRRCQALAFAIVSTQRPTSEPTEHANGMSTDDDAPVAEQGPQSKAGGLPIKMLNDRILVQIESAEGDRRSSGGILIPATAQVGKRLTWARVMAIGPSVRSLQLEDRVLFNPEDRYEVEVGGRDFIILRERDVHAVAAERLDDSHTGLYL